MRILNRIGLTSVTFEPSQSTCHTIGIHQSCHNIILTVVEPTPFPSSPSSRPCLRIFPSSPSLHPPFPPYSPSSPSTHPPRAPPHTLPHTHTFPTPTPQGKQHRGGNRHFVSLRKHLCTTEPLHPLDDLEAVCYLLLASISSLPWRRAVGGKSPAIRKGKDGMRGAVADLKRGLIRREEMGGAGGAAATNGSAVGSAYAAKPPTGAAYGGARGGGGKSGGKSKGSSGRAAGAGKAGKGPSSLRPVGGGGVKAKGAKGGTKGGKAAGKTKAAKAKAKAACAPLVAALFRSAVMVRDAQLALNDAMVNASSHAAAGGGMGVSGRGNGKTSGGGSSSGSGGGGGGSGLRCQMCGTSMVEPLAAGGCENGGGRGGDHRRGEGKGGSEKVEGEKPCRGCVWRKSYRRMKGLIMASAREMEETG